MLDEDTFAVFEAADGADEASTLRRIAAASTRAVKIPEEYTIKIPEELTIKFNLLKQLLVTNQSILHYANVVLKSSQPCRNRTR